MINFKDMPSHSRIWIYQSIREFSENEITQLKVEAEGFINEWTSHAKKMKACIEIFYNRFIILCVDETSASASGCGIDKSVKFIQQLEKEFNTSLLDRMNVAYRKKIQLNDEVSQRKIVSCSITEFKKNLSFSEEMKGITVFNNLVTTKKEFEKNWEVPLEISWHKNLFS